MMQKKEMSYNNTFSEQGARLLVENNGCAVWQFRNETGDGTMTAYDVFPGVMLSFNDFHMKHYDSGYVADRNLLVIDHCREGRMEYTAARNSFAYIGAGDMKLDRRKFHTGIFEFPSCHYHGLTIAMDLDIVRTSLASEIKDFPVTPERIIDRFQLEEYPKVIHGVQTMEHIFGEMYQVPEKIRTAYFKVKILEMMLYLDVINIPKEDDEHPYFYRTQVEKIKAVQGFLAENISENYTQEELSKKFDFPLTAMKNCFRSVYGTSIGAWITDYRMNRAAELLSDENELNIAEIGGMVGYDSASKFAASFKKVMKLTPSEYRMERGKRHGEGNE